jgi:hypothetical protein
VERQQSLFFAAALPNSLTYAEPDLPAVEIVIKIPKTTQKGIGQPDTGESLKLEKASFWPMGVRGGGSDHLLEILSKPNPP